MHTSSSHSPHPHSPPVPSVTPPKKPSPLTPVRNAHLTLPPPRFLLPTLLILLSSLFFSFMNTTVRYVTHELHLPILLAAFSRGVIQCILSFLLLVLLPKPSLSRNSVLTLSFRGLLGALSMTCKFATLSRLPVAIASSLFAISPFFASMLAYGLLNEALSLHEGAALILTTVGAALVCGSTLNRTEELDANLVGMALGVLSASLTGAVFVSVRYLGETVHFLLNVFALSVGCIVTPIALTASSGGLEAVVDFFSAVRHLVMDEIVALCGVGLFAFAAASCLNRGLQLTKAGRASVLRTCDIPINYFVAFVILGELPLAFGQVFGCAIIVLSTAYVALM